MSVDLFLLTLHVKRLFWYIHITSELRRDIRITRTRHFSTWFGFNGKVISWLTSYLPSCRLIIVIINSTSAQSSLGQGVPQGSVLGPLLFILNTTPFSSLVSESYVGHHVYRPVLMTINFSFLLSSLNFPLKFTPASHSWSCLLVDIFQSFFT